MRSKELFISWMEENTSLSKSSIAKYARAITINSNSLREYNLLEGSLYNINDSALIEGMKELYLSVPSLKEKDIRGNRMYSSAFNYLKKFVNTYNQ